MMNIDLSLVTDIIGIHEEKLLGNRELTNELLVDELMLALGYDKKRNTGVKRLYDEEIDWEVSSDGHKRLAVKTMGYGKELGDNILDTADIVNHDLVIVTNGTNINIYCLEIQDNEPIFKINILNKKEEDDRVLRSISLEEYSVDNLKEEFMKSIIKVDDINEVIENNLEYLTDYILTMAEKSRKKKNVEIVQERLTNMQLDHGTLDYIDSLEVEVNRLGLDVERLQEENEDYRNEVDRLTKVISEGNSESGLRAKVAELLGDKSILEEKIKELEQHIDDLKTDKKSKIEQLEDDAKALIDAVDDNPESERAYVAVIDNKLIREESISRFIGLAIQELYIKIGNDVLPYLFDSDLYVLKQPANRNDLRINNKNYDISLDGITEDEAISKLIKLYKNFKVIFKCKMVGRELPLDEVEHLEDEQGTTELIDYGTEEEVEDSPSEQSEVSGKYTGKEYLNKEEGTDGIESDDRDTEDEGFEYEQPELDDLVDEGMIAVPISKLNEIAWEDGVELTDIMYIGKEGQLYSISKNVSRGEKYYPNIICKTIDAMLALTEEFSRGVEALKSADLSEVSMYLEQVNESNRHQPRVAFTRYAITDLDNISKCVPIINEIANIINIDTDKVTIYFKGDYEKGCKAEEYEVKDNEIVLTDSAGFEPTDNGDQTYIAASGSITDQVIITMNSLEAQSHIFEKCVAIKTKYMALRINDDEDIVSIFKTMIDQRVNTDEDLNCRAIGKVIGEEHYIISKSVEDVTDDSLHVNAGGEDYYISRMEEWQLIYALIKAHAVMFKNKAMGIKIKINQGAYQYYRGNFRSSEPSLGLSIRSITEYIKDRI